MDNTSKILELLAQKLGTTTQYLWLVMINQAKIDAMITLFKYGIMAIVGYILLRLHKKLSLEDKDGYSSYDNNEIYGILMFGAAIVYCTLLITALFFIGDVINGFFNPEYWALNKILNYISCK